MENNLEVTTLGAGCFWCIEAIFQDVKGVHKVVSGYTGGHIKNPSYDQICTGTTGHAEVAQITFDPSVISFEDILYIFWRTHDPTTLNRQGNDSGTQYRSAIFYHSEEQKNVAEKSKAEISASGLYSDPIVTEVSPATEFYSAEAYHQNFYKNNPNQSYCRFVIDPKVNKFRKAFAEKLNVA
jgi:peptide-methionine (S)-S-oxide reductase